jgi:uncharacterized protein (TIGR03435 family)
MRPSTRGEIYEIKNGSMADLISLAYNSNVTKVIGGPSWLEMDKFDITAKQPSQTPLEQQRGMLRALLEDRFKLVAKEETRPIPSFALTSNGKHKLKEADGKEETGCKPQASNAPASPSSPRLMMANPNGGDPIVISLNDGMIEYKCRNMTMAAFAAGIKTMPVPNLGVNPILDQTNLAGVWNFDLKYSLGLIGLPGASTDQITFFEAVEKQLGLKLEEKQLPGQVIVVSSVNRQPTENPPGTAEVLPRNATPKEFEVASIKPTGAGSTRSMFQTQPGGRLTGEGMPMTFLLQRAFLPQIPAQLAEIPTWAGTAKFDIQAQAALDSAQAPLDPDTLAPMMLALLQERFGLKYHVEQREVQAYDLVAAKPKMKKADPEARSWCKAPTQVPGAAPAPQGSQALICQNVTMTQFAELLRGRTPDLQAPMMDQTGLEGGWDFRLTFNPLIGIAALARPALEGAAPAGAIGAAAGTAGAAPSPLSAASDPVAGTTIFEALEKQLGVKLEKVKRSVGVTVIDHLDQAPSEN